MENGSSAGNHKAPVSPLLCLPPRLEEVCKRVRVRAFRAMRLKSYSYFDRSTRYCPYRDSELLTYSCRGWLMNGCELEHTISMVDYA